jgi:hypothetical protein
LEEKDCQHLKDYFDTRLGDCKHFCTDKFVTVYNTMEILFESQKNALTLASKELDSKFLTISKGDEKYGIRLNELEKTVVSLQKIIVITGLIGMIAGALAGGIVALILKYMSGLE